MRRADPLLGYHDSREQADDTETGLTATFRQMPLTQAQHRRLRLVFSIRTAVTVAAACYGYYLGIKAAGHLADALSVGLTVGAVAFAVAFALGAAIGRSRSPAEMLYRDRELATLGVSSLRGAVTVALLALSYMGLSGCGCRKLRRGR